MRTWIFPDRRPEAAGPWDQEPDKIQWIDKLTDLDCLMVRGHRGAWCGYVGVPPDHPWHGWNYYECLQACDENWCSHDPRSLTEVHGGLTYANSCDEVAENGNGICHVPESGRPADVWWFGFDCQHAFDLMPFETEFYERCHIDVKHLVYRDVAYVRDEVMRLAVQLARVAV